MKEILLQKIKNRDICVGVVGLGYVGLPLAVEIAKNQFKTLGFDINKEKVSLINAGINYIQDVQNETLAEVVDKKFLYATTDFSCLKSCNFIIICVPTPLDKHQQPDISYIRSSVEVISQYLEKNTVVVLESTTYPGTTEDLVKSILEEKSGLKCETDFYLGFSPERVDPGNKTYKTHNTPKVVGGIGKDANFIIAEMYREVLDSEIFEVSSPAVAEMEKILENTYRNVNIGLINEMAMLCNEMGISIWEVIDAAKTKPYGFHAFYPGPGLGGHCIPLDPCYLSWKAREYGFHTTMIENSMMINDRMPEYCIERASKLLNSFGKSLNGSKVLILGISYKEDVADYRESPAIKVIQALIREKALVNFYDPYVPEYINGEVVMEGLTEITPQITASYDLVIITTAHTNIDYCMIQENANLIFDTRNVMKNIVKRDNIEVL